MITYEMQVTTSRIMAIYCNVGLQHGEHPTPYRTNTKHLKCYTCSFGK